jgi:hypothetical protein
VKVWVPSAKDARDILEIAAEMRERAKSLHGFSDEVPIVSDEMAVQLGQALAEHPPLPRAEAPDVVLDLIEKLAEAGELQSVARAFAILVRAKPIIAASAKRAIPNNIEKFLIEQREISPAVLKAWREAHGQWDDEIRDAIRDPALFEQMVEQMAHEIKRSAG